MLRRTFRIEVYREHPGEGDSQNKLIEIIKQRGIETVTDCLSARLFFVHGDLDHDTVNKLAHELVVNPVTERFTVVPIEVDSSQSDYDHSVEVMLLPGVTDPVAENLLRSAKVSGIENVVEAATGQRYLLSGNPSKAELEEIATYVLSNPVIQQVAIDKAITPPFVSDFVTDDAVETIELRDADDKRLLAISTERRLALNLNEMQSMQSYFCHEGREPNDVELEMLAQTWSEHCIHKTFRAKIVYSDTDGEKNIDGLLNSYIRSATEKINKPWVQSAFVDDAGIVTFTDEFDLAFKVETHNHPSAIEPFGGANTGVGGVIRDVLGVSARPIANTDILCFGIPDAEYKDLPQGVLHPKRIESGVVHGIEDYGNKMGIPTVNGAIVYHPGYTANPLVYCGCLGILPHGLHPTQAQPGDLIIVMGGRTGRDGLRGATFSSMEMDGTTGKVAGSAVQIGHPINEKQVQEVVTRARDEKLYTAITDCGAGGLSSSVGEMGEKLGVKVQLQDVPLKYAGLRPWEIWLSEAQERMVMAVPPENWPRVQEICAGQDVEVVCIGTFEPTGRLQLFYGEKMVADIAMEFLHDGIPQMQLKAEWKAPVFDENEKADIPDDLDLTDTLLRLLAHPNIRSKEDVIRRYDHEVQGGTAIKPLTGVKNHGPSDATVLVPYETQGTGNKAVAIANGINPHYGGHDPYAMAWANIDEAMRNLVAVGADPDQIAILDNFCWGNPNLPDRLGSLVRCVEGCHDAAIAYGTPFISGKDSLNNEYADTDGERHAIPGTLLISAIGIVPDVEKTVTMDLKEPGNILYVIGGTHNEMAGSHYNLINGIKGGTVPQPNPDALKTMRALHQAIQAGLIQSCHDVSEGGIAVALAEMCIAGGLGAVGITGDISNRINPFTPDYVALFSESTGRFIVEVRPEDQKDFLSLIQGIDFIEFGVVRTKRQLHFERHLWGKQWEDHVLIHVGDIEGLENAWRRETIKNDNVTVGAIRGTPLPSDTKAQKTSSVRTDKPRVLILHANGTNRDRDILLACEMAGGEPEIVHINRLLNNERNLLDYHMLVVPGGFSYGDDLGAGRLWALDLQYRLSEQVNRFVESGRPVLGVCNGFQVMVKSGLLPGPDFKDKVTLTHNKPGEFECRWVYLKANSRANNLFLDGLDELIYCPVAHGEGRIAVTEDAVAEELQNQNLIALSYVNQNGVAVGYPGNPNGSVLGIAGLTNPAGNVLGLMPHPENHIFDWQHPRHKRGESGLLGLRLFLNGIKNA